MVKCSIAPWLSVRDGAQAVDFYKAAFKAAEVYRLDVPDGGIVARLSVDGAEFWLSGESPGAWQLESGVSQWRFRSNDLDCGKSGRYVRTGDEGWCIRGLPCWRSTRLAIGPHR
jgi:hypothetical protein